MHISKVQNNTPFLGFSLFSKKPKKEDFQTFGEVHNKENNELNVKVPTDGYKSFFCPKAAGKGKGKKEVTIKKGRAVEWGIRPYTGLAIFRNKKDELIGLEYKNGEITASYKGNGLYKKYEYLPQNEALKESGFNFSHKFQDGSTLEEEAFYGMDDVTYKKITTKPKGSTTYIKRNNSPKYKGEPVLSVYSDKKHPKLINAGGIEKVEFKTLNDAQSYFLAEYGIDVDFIDLKQAHLMKDALDEFAKLNYKGKGKKLFEGLYIGQLPGAPEQQGEFSIKFFYNNPEKEKVPDLKEKDESYFEDHMQVITFNPLYCWDNLEFAERRAEEINLHPSFKATNPMIHEFAHLLHVMDSPKAFYFYAENEPEIEEKPIIQMVSDYATNNVGEFVAEYISGRLAGKTYPKVVDALYKKYGGPDLFSSI